jgi:hypothetical protein
MLKTVGPLMILPGRNEAVLGYITATDIPKAISSQAF